MPQDYHTPQEYSLYAALVEIAQAVDDRLCGMGTLSFIAGSLLVVGISASAGLAALMGV
ncbi:hypothetical protein [Azospirillum sp. TSA2s]|uniref:hypothetical protein n=1 Tax=Azospirillum sp. TSA2s TaxID=709810 RepID=UPI00145ADD8E|nr:hypothetical protein [Azospirillum sp. TSA2s]